MYSDCTVLKICVLHVKVMCLYYFVVGEVFV